MNYQIPHPDILQLADFEPSPVISINHDATEALLMHRKLYKSISEMDNGEMRLAGIRVSPRSYTSTNVAFRFNVTHLDLHSGVESHIEGLPHNGKFSHFTWNRPQTHVAFLSHDDNGASLWVLDISQKRASQLTESKVNAIMGSVFLWGPKQEFIYVKMRLDTEEPIISDEDMTPEGPLVFENDGDIGQNRTYQDLLKNQTDVENFKRLTTCKVCKVYLDGRVEEMLSAGIYKSMSISPDQSYFMISRILEPFSYLVPFERFHTQYELYTSSGDFIKIVFDQPLTETLPKGFMASPTYPRYIGWRLDQPATLSWVQALDGGDPSVVTEYRDEILTWKSPFVDEDFTSIFRTKDRFSRITWGDAHHAIVQEYWFHNRMQRQWLIHPDDASVAPRLLDEGNYQDIYQDIGSWAMDRNEFMLSTLYIQNGKLALIGAGHSEETKKPFIDVVEITTLSKERILEINNPEKLESIIHLNDLDKGEVITMIQSKNDFPNFYRRNFKEGTLQAITQYPNPFEILHRVHKEVVTYLREDGLSLSATLYLPIDFQPGQKYPMLMWAYPEEHTDRSTAAQHTKYNQEFTFPHWGGPLYWVLRGYVVMDEVAFPIVGEGDKSPNDTYLPQLISNAKAAIDFVANAGWVDRTKVAIGGHSYGAFMVANLLTHSDLFAAGIARSGAYNRTLTPFGFQAEERNYWDAKDVYVNMSPFHFAEKMKSALLLIHGEKDENSGTFTIQSERYYQALKSLGAVVRYVCLPKEKHGYAARESILHMLWEQDVWLEKHLQPKRS